MNRLVQITLMTGCIALFLAACQKKEAAQTQKKETVATEKTAEEQWEPEKVSSDTAKPAPNHEGHDHDHHDHDGHNH